MTDAHSRLQVHLNGCSTCPKVVDADPERYCPQGKDLLQWWLEAEGVKPHALPLDLHRRMREKHRAFTELGRLGR